MKNKLKIILTLLIVAVLCVSIAACKDEDPTRHTVTFAGEGVTTFTQTVDDGGTVMEPKDPERDGYDFVGWFREGATAAYDFSTPVRESFTLTASWTKSEDPSPKGDFDGKGTYASPYLIANAADMEKFATHVNDGDEGYYDAFYRLTADIDLSQEDFTPIGEIIEDKDIFGFEGDFDGNGHKITGVKIQTTVRNAGIIGFFGYTYMANIHNLTVEYDFSVACYNGTASIVAGGVVAYAVNTNFRNVSSIGTVETDLMAENSVLIGGIAGILDMEDDNGAVYIAYVENCYASLTTTIVNEGKAEGGSLERAAIGGLFGSVETFYGMYGAVAIVNSATAGSIHGGMYAGGLVGSMGGNISVIDCLSSATVQPTAQSVSYAGGLVGMSSGNNLIADSIFTGTVRGKQASTSSSYQSYTGGIVGYAPTDDYDGSYAYIGSAVVNSYYSGRITGTTGTTVSKFGASATFTEDLLFNTLNWAQDCWTVSGTSAVPTTVKRSDLANSYKVTYVSNGATVETVSYDADDGYNVLGNPSPLENVAPKVFWDWELDDGVAYRFYMPVVKNVTLTAKWFDVSEIAGQYNGTGTAHETNNAGTIVIHNDGTLEWINSSLWTGSYRFDGAHLVAECGFIGDFIATFDFTGSQPSFSFIYDATISSDVVYEFTKTEQEIVLLGEYLSDIGDIFTFAGDGTLTFQSHKFNNGKSIRGNYEISGSTITFSGSVAGAFASIVGTLNVDGSFNITATEKPGSYSLSNVKFAKMLGLDYSNKAFPGDYNMSYVTGQSGGTTYSNLQYLTLNANGTGVFSTPNTSRTVRYYYFEVGSERYIKYIDDSYVSIFYYDQELGIFWGRYSRGDTAYSDIIIAPASQGDMYSAATGDRSVMLFVTETRMYAIVNGEFIKHATITGEFKDGARITIDGQGYRLSLENMASYNKYCTLYTIGDEEGDYTYNGRRFTLDGIGNIVEGDKVSGFYALFADSRIVVVFDDDTVLSFTYTDAKSASGTVTALSPTNAYIGVWYGASGYNPIGDDGYVDTSVTIQDAKYYKLIMDGFGNMTLMYHKYGQEYTPNWEGWGPYYQTATGIHGQFNSAQIVDMVFYYDMKVVISTKFGGRSEGMTFVKDGYTGPTTPPVFDATLAGRYTGQENSGAQVILNLRADCTGDFKGAPFVGVYDGDKTVRFTLGGVDYAVVFDSAVTISYGSEVVTLTKGGAIQEVIPAALAGTWTCSEVTGMNATGTFEFVIQVTGSISFQGAPLNNVQYNHTTLVITASNSMYSFTLTYNTSEGTFYISWQDADSRSWYGTFTKAEA